MPRSLKLRAAAGAVLWCALALISVGWAIHQLQIRSAERQFDTWLSAHLTELAASVAIAAPNAETIANRMPDPRFHQPFSGFYWQAQGPQAMLYSRSLWDTQLALPQDELPDGALHRHDIAGPNQTGLRVLERTVRRADGEVWRIAVAADRKILDHETRRFSHALIISLAVLAVLFRHVSTLYRISTSTGVRTGKSQRALLFRKKTSRHSRHSFRRPNFLM